MQIQVIDTENNGQLLDMLINRQVRTSTARPRPNNRPGDIDLLTWTILRRRWLTPKIKFDLARHAYLSGIYQCEERIVDIMKAAQIGVSEYFVSYDLHACDERNMDVFHIMPTLDDVSKFGRTRFAQALEASRHLQSLVVKGGLGADGRRGADLATLRRISNSWLYLNGAQVDDQGKAHQLDSAPADALVVDELDKMDERAPTIAVERLGHSDVQEERYGSTPTYVGEGIHKRWLLTNQMEWFVRCTYCGETRQITMWKVAEKTHFIVTERDELGRPRDWHGRKKGTAYVACCRCGRKLNHTGPGTWVARYPDRQDRFGFHPTKLHTRQRPLIEIVNKLNTADRTQMKEVTNQDLGEPFSPVGGQLNDDNLNACIRDYGAGPRGDQRPVMGVDVGAWLHVVIRGKPEGDKGERPQLLAAEVESWAELGRIVKRFNVGCGVIDFLPETTKAKEFQGEFPDVIWLCLYSEGENAAAKLEEGVRWDLANGVAHANRTMIMDKMFERFYDQVNTLPVNIRNVEGYYDQLKAPIREVEKIKNRPSRAVYKEGGKPDHYAHAEVYAYIASLPKPVRQTAVATATVTSSSIVRRLFD